MSEFYAIDSTRVSLREYWWGSKSPLVIIAWIIKWLHIRIPSSSDDPNVDSTLPFVVDASSPEIAATFEELTKQLGTLGFHEPVFYVIPDPGTRTTTYWAVFQHTSGRHFTRIHHRIWRQSAKPNRGLFPMFFTEFTDGIFLVSSSGKPDMAAPETVQMNRMPGVAAITLWETHERLAHSLSERKMVRPVSTREDLIRATERHHALVRDFHLGRGVFRRRTPAEQAGAEAYTTKLEELPASGQENADVLVELDRLQQQKPGWQTMFWVLLLSLGAFVAAGASQWKWKTTLWLIPVLLFHECGHWVAMRIFGYRNLRMFFIPLFGAAVIGRHWNVPGWKKALVSLAGPVPGIALGVLLGIAGLVSHQDWMNRAALILLIINGSNLVPILPLDGGHVVQATLFCRNRWLDAAFRIATIVGLFALGFFGIGRWLKYLAIGMALTLPIVFKLAKVAENLRRTPLPPPLPGEDRIPPATAQAIIKGVRAAFPPKVPLTSKALAQHTLGVYETLNAKPPSVPATLALLALHGGAFAAAGLLCLLLIINKQGGLGDFVRAATRQPQHSLDCGNIQHWIGSDRQPIIRNTLVTTFNTRREAATAFAEVTNEAPPTASATLFGDSLLLTLPAENDTAREQWFDDLQRRSTNTFVALSNTPVMVAMTFLAPTSEAATNLAKEIREYFEVSGNMNLIAPWSPEASRATYGRFRHARETWHNINEEVSQAWRDPSLKTYATKSAAARKRGAMAEVRRLETEQEEKLREIQAQAIERLRTRSTKEAVELLELHTQLGTLNYTNRTERKELYRQIAAKLGEVAYDDDKPAPGADAYGVTMGLIMAHGLLIEVRWAGFDDPAIGLSAFSEWLCGKGCRQIRYEFNGSGLAGGSDEEEY